MANRICDDCPEHSAVKKVQSNRDVEQQKQWDKIGELEKCANAAKRVAASKVGAGFVILALGIVLTVCGIGFKVIYDQNRSIVSKVHEVREKVIALETKIAEQDRYEGRGLRK